MKWIIKNERFDMTDLMVSVNFEPQNKPLRYFLSGINLTNLPGLLDSLMNNKGYYEPYLSVRFFEELDWEDLEDFPNISKGKVLISHEVYGDSILDKLLFFKLIQEYSLKIIEIYGDDEDLVENWKDNMIKNLKELNSKL